MKHGTIICDCGQEFFFETVRKSVHCIRCGKWHDASDYPENEGLIEKTDEEE